MYETDSRDHVEISASQRAVLEPEAAIGAPDHAAVQCERPHVGADRRHGVGDQEYPARTLLGSKRNSNSRWVDVDAVRDQPGMERIDVERCPGETRFAISDLAHRIENMRHYGCAGLRRGGR